MTQSNFEKFTQSTKEPYHPESFLLKHAVTLHRIVNNEIPSFEWLALHLNLTLRMVNFKVIPQFNYKVGQNILTNRFSVINGQIPLNWLNKSYASFKLLCKKEFL